MIESNSYEWRYLEIEKGIPHAERIRITATYLPTFDYVLRGNKFSFKRRHDCSKLIQNSAVPTKYLLDLRGVKEAVVIGKMFLPDEIPEVIRNKLWNSF
jgi:hypothetical protein